MNREFHERLIDRQFARFISGIAGNDEELFALLVSMASNAPGNGHICLNLEDLAGESLTVEGKNFDLPALSGLRELLMHASTTGVPGQFRPLILDTKNRLYLYRYWRYEHDLAVALLEKAEGTAGSVDEELLAESLERLFTDALPGEENRQKAAAAIALRRQLCIISGGPGTGKTSTVVRILALLLMQEGGLNLRIAMAAPTGKAAARLRASVSDIRRDLDCSESVRSAIPESVVTIHRLLGTAFRSHSFRYGASNRLPYDLVIVDEASMIALPLMHALLQALRPGARLILLGDRDQLASVEAGAVLGDICTAGEMNAASPLGRSMVMLKKNFRFSEKSGIGELSRLINVGRGQDAMHLLKSSPPGTLSWQQLTSREELNRALPEKIVDGYRSYTEATTPAEALERFERFRIVCALRDGPFGVSGLNGDIERILRRANLISATGPDYRCRPLLVTANDHRLQLFNGDTGILFPDPESQGELRAFFPAAEGGMRKLAPVRVPEHETAFAMTVHKSQGSEFERVLLILPPARSDILTRELLYTAITRARSGVEIWGDEALFTSAVSQKSVRNSGLTDALLHEEKGEEWKRLLMMT
ncbi:exodeoxyribonuclease V subunit alpha [Chlorobium sp. KB01]|uniref:exodeoxyribonuclease V subunit alpha n=1 Tax=Chlorobium sp. KB01 TaxID=1917528 RepID=UPI0009770F5B|nr:exodeoxyribonuclease V subunit alpha [Chlorobium sp. KB01]